MRELEGRIRKVEQTIRGAEDEQWRKLEMIVEISREVWG